MKSMKTAELMRMGSKTSGLGLSRAASRAYLITKESEID